MPKRNNWQVVRVELPPEWEDIAVATGFTTGEAVEQLMRDLTELLPALDRLAQRHCLCGDCLAGIAVDRLLAGGASETVEAAFMTVETMSQDEAFAWLRREARRLHSRP